MNDFNDYVLVLPSWYPSKVDAFNGDFNERFVHAVSKYRKQIVVYAVRNDNLSQIEIESKIEPNVITHIAYYPKKASSVYSQYKVFRLYISILSSIFRKYGKPKIVHTYVFYPAGVISLYLKYRYNLKSIVTENWTTFYKEQINYINKNNFLKKYLYSKIIKSFDVVIAVANRLEKEIRKWNSKSKNFIIPNVVNISHFNFDEVSLKGDNEPFRLLHVSTMGYQKNVSGILNVLEDILDKFKLNVELVLAGTYNPEIVNKIADSKSLSEHVKYIGEIPYQKVAKEMKKAHAFILFSRYENMPCVLLESLCTGLPIITTNVGGIAEIINDNNGILVDNENEIQLREAILYMVSNYHKYDKQEISKNSIEEYSYDRIGEKISAIYTDLENS